MLGLLRAALTAGEIFETAILVGVATVVGRVASDAYDSVTKKDDENDDED